MNLIKANGNKQAVNELNINGPIVNEPDSPDTSMNTICI